MRKKKEEKREVKSPRMCETMLEIWIERGRREEKCRRQEKEDGRSVQVLKREM